ncbi:MAG: hypothetical protein IKQ91_07765 [Oscillospiraceae bacterium]|nr:hypothetical protein [Oscillospiraceae bacterium]
MDDLTQKLQSLLSDPESMRNLSELAQMLREPDGNAAQEAAPAAADSAAEPPPMDFSKLLAVGQALSAVQQDETAALILALRPHLSAERAKRADQAVRLLKLYAAAGVLRENGVLNDLLNPA